MARFYGTVKGTGATPATRCGHQSLTVTAESYNGDVVVQFVRTDGTDDQVQIYIRDHKGKRDNTRVKLLYAGCMSKLLDASERATMLRALVGQELVEG